MQGYVGLGLLAIGVYPFLREYVVYLDKRAAEYSEMLAFLSHLEREIGSFLRTVPEACDSFRDGFLRSSGALGLIASSRGGGGELLSGSLIDKEDKRALSEFFDSFGMGYREIELRRLSEMKASFSETVKRVKDECAKNKRLAPLLFAFAFSALLVLLL